MSYLSNINNMWKFASLATLEPHMKEDCRWFGSANFLMPMKNNLDFGYILEFPHFVVIAFRGTNGSLKAWANNLDPFCLEKDVHGSNIREGKGYIHDGWYHSWEPFKKPIEDYIRMTLCDVPEFERTTPKSQLGNAWHRYQHHKPIFITGHSRGGVMATLAARHLAKNLGLYCLLYTFGSPAVGTQPLVDEMNRLPVSVMRIVNGYDFAQFTPPNIFNIHFKHVGVGSSFIQFDKPRWHRYWLPARIKSHYYSEYTKSLIKYNKDLLPNSSSADIVMLNELLDVEIKQIEKN